VKHKARRVVAHNPSKDELKDGMTQQSRPKQYQTEILSLSKGYLRFVVKTFLEYGDTKSAIYVDLHNMFFIYFF